MPKVIQVIESDVHRGMGTPESVYRIVRQYHSLDGEFLAERDPVACVAFIDLEKEKQAGDIARTIGVE